MRTGSTPRTTLYALSEKHQERRVLIRNLHANDTALPSWRAA
jgi:hypothetical protein